MRNLFGGANTSSSRAEVPDVSLATPVDGMS